MKLLKHIFLIAALFGLSALQSFAGNLESTVRSLESSGGTGVWFNSELPQQLGGTKGRFYLLRSIPYYVNPSSPLFLLRSAQSVKILNYLLVGQGTPIVLGDFDETSRFEAATLSGFKLSKDVMALTPTRAKRNIILMKSNCSIFTLMHENRHWLDQENLPFMQSMAKDLNSLTRSLGIEKYSGKLLQLILEIRGHSVQASQALVFQKNNVPYVGRAGQIILGPKAELDMNYFVERKMAKDTFRTIYIQALTGIFNLLPRQEQLRLLQGLSKYDFSNDPENEITFKEMLGLR